MGGSSQLAQKMIQKRGARLDGHVEQILLLAPDADQKPRLTGSKGLAGQDAIEASKGGETWNRLVRCATTRPRLWRAAGSRRKDGPKTDGFWLSFRRKLFFCLVSEWLTKGQKRDAWSKRSPKKD